MIINEQYLLYTFAADLVKNHQFKLVYINHKTNEVWLEKYENRSSKIVRMIHKGFDWKNHLKRDISFLYQRIMSAKRLFGKNIEVYNLYFTTHPPVDTWEALKRPILSQGKKPIKMHVYYLDENDYPDEIERFQNDLLAAPINYDLEQSNEVKEDVISSAKQNFAYALNNKQQEYTTIFRFGKPIFSYILIAINILLFILLEMNGGSTSIETLINYGAKYNTAIMENGEWWRLFSSMFLHIGILHLAMNMLAIFYLGIAVEKIYGSLRFLFIYVIAGIGGSIASFAFSTSISAGASGAIFGLFGALLYFGTVHKRLFFQTMGSSILLIIAINFVIGLSIEEIDMAAHFGGLVVGFFAAAIVNLPKNKNLKIQLLACLATIILFFGTAYYGVHANTGSQSFQLLKLQEYIDAEEYPEAIEIASEALNLEGDLESVILFQRSYAYIELGEYDKALVDLEKSTSYSNPLPEAYYNLALLYQMDGREDAAAAAIEKAYEMNPEGEGFAEQYEKITGEKPLE
ncbi:rhomboid family intramembrane serine protease [Oceanobacillus sp. FSL H7-0719]|uniref:rhomboid family intramembrane serine protease n=1 Tax=Oceanobacillus sp. FSL H7-0719 TaxID=2954507 RepID=UPI00324CE3D4